jgi:hypothetical protein
MDDGRGALTCREWAPDSAAPTPKQLKPSKAIASNSIQIFMSLIIK